MFFVKKIYFEVLAYTNVNDRPDFMEKFANEKDAGRCGRSIKDRYMRVEVNAVYVDAEDENNVLDGKLVSAWENGIKTA